MGNIKSDYQRVSYCSGKRMLLADPGHCDFMNYCETNNNIMEKEVSGAEIKKK